MTHVERDPDAVKPSGSPRARHYVGDDRRHAPGATNTSDVGILVISVLVAGVVWGLFELAIATNGRALGAVDERAFGSLLNTVIAMLGGITGALIFVFWRMTGLTRPMWIGGGVMLYAGVAVGLGHLVPELVETDTELLDAFTVGGSALAAVLIGAGAIVPEVDTRIRFRWVFLTSAVVAGATAALLDALNAVDLLTGTTGRWILVGAWAAVVVVHLVAPGQRRTRTHLAVAAAGVALLCGELTRVLALGAPESDEVVWGILGAMALGLILAQVLRDLESVYFHQRGRLLDSEVSIQAAAAQRRAGHAVDAERAHDAKNALLAIEGAALTLERYRDRLDPERRAALSTALSAEIARLQGLVEAQRTSDDEGPFDVVAMVTTIIDEERQRGLVIDADLPDQLAALGRPADTAEVLHTLFENARRHAPGSPVHVRGEVDGDWVVVYVADRGQGVNRSERHRIFEPPRRPETSNIPDGEGLGLFVSRRLMLGQHGDMWVEHRPGGGASFGVCLPLAPATTHDDEPAADRAFVPHPPRSDPDRQPVGEQVAP